MAELIGLISSIIGIAGAGLTLAQKLHDYADGVSSSSRRAQQIAFHVRTTAICIEEVGSVLEEEEIADRVLVSQNALNTVRDIVEQCGDLFEEISGAVRSAENGGNGMGRLRFPFRESRIVLMMSDLERLKTTLQLLMQVVVYARVRAVQSVHQPTQRKLVEELIALRRQALVTYKRNRKEAERAEATEESISAATLPDGTAGPAVLASTPREISTGARADYTIAARPLNPTDDQPPPTQEPEMGISNITIQTATHAPNPPSPVNGKNPPESSPAGSTPADNIPLQLIPTQPSNPKQKTNANHSTQDNDTTLNDFLTTFLNSLKFICCCPCLYLHRRSTRQQQLSDPGSDALLGMGFMPRYPGENLPVSPQARYESAVLSLKAQGMKPSRPVAWSGRGGYSVMDSGSPFRGFGEVGFSRSGDGLLGDVDEVEELVKRWTNLYALSDGSSVRGVDG